MQCKTDGRLPLNIKAVQTEGSLYQQCSLMPTGCQPSDVSAPSLFTIYSPSSSRELSSISVYTTSMVEIRWSLMTLLQLSSKCSKLVKPVITELLPCHGLGAYSWLHLS